MDSITPVKPLSNSDHLALRVNPNGMQPLIIASFTMYSIPGLLSLVAPAAGAAFVTFERSAAFPAFYFLLVFTANFVGAGETPKRLSKYLNAVRAGTGYKYICLI